MNRWRRILKVGLVGAASIFCGGCSINTPGATLEQTAAVVLPTAAPVDTEITGRAAAAAKDGVVRIICRRTSFGGTGFLHKSGAVITAAHVVAGCAVTDLSIRLSAASDVAVVHVVADDVKDLALLRLKHPLPGKPLLLATASVPRLGSQVTTWGYPGGYDGPVPLLSAGYFAGTQDFQISHGEKSLVVRRWVINAAFNGGNSGGPVFAVEDGRVIGVVASKLAPLPKQIETILEALDNNRQGLQFNATRADGSNQSFSESQLIAAVLQYLRTQVQLVIGYAVTTEDLNAFLKTSGVTP